VQQNLNGDTEFQGKRVNAKVFTLFRKLNASPFGTQQKALDCSLKAE